MQEWASPVVGFLFGPPGMGEMAILAVVGLLIFGKRLPEVGRSLGKGIVEFKKGLAGVKDEIDQAGMPAAPPTGTGPQHRPPDAVGAQESTPKHDTPDRESS